MGDGAEQSGGSPADPPPGPGTRLGHLLAEARRRRVFRVLVGYGLFSFAVLQVVEPVMHGLHLGDWLLTVVLAVLALGFPVAVILSWVFDLTTRGVTRTPSDPLAISLSRGALAALLIGVGLLAALPGVAWYLLRAPSVPPATAPAAPATPSIAVLPFADLSPQHDQEYFADGMAEEILDALAQVDGLRVAGRTSSFAFKGKNEDLVSIAQKLRVGAVLEGSVRVAGNRVRITAQLVNASDGFRAWSQTFDRELTGVFAIQEEIARAVAGALKVKLLPERAGAARRRAIDPEAYRLYLLARQQQALGTVDALDRAIAALRQAGRLAPEDALVQAQLATTSWSRWTIGDAGDLQRDPEALAWWRGLFGNGFDFARANRVVMEMAERAVTLGPDLPEVYATRGWLRHVVAGDWAAARTDDERALALAPGDVTTRTIYARLLATLGQVPEALAIMLRVAEDDPLWPTAWLWMGHLQDGAGEARAAELSLRRGLELAPDNAYLLRELGFSLLLQGRAAETLAIAERNPVKWFRSLLESMAHHQLGDEAASRKALEQLVAGGDGWSYQIAQAYAWRGASDQAFRWLDRGLATNDAGLRFVTYDPMVRSLRGDARFRALLRRMKLPTG